MIRTDSLAGATGVALLGLLLAIWSCFAPAGVNAQPPAKSDAAKSDQANADEAKADEKKAPAQGEASDEAEWTLHLGRDEKEDRLKLAKYSEFISKAPAISEEDRKMICDVIRWKLAQFTLKQNREPPPRDADALRRMRPAYKPLHMIRRDILNDINLAGNLGGNKDMRPELLKCIVKECPPLLDYHFAARLNCAILLAELNAQRDAESPYEPAHQLQIKIARDANQLDAVRIWGARGCGRLLQYSQTSAEVRNTVTKALTELLKEHNKQSKDEKLKHDWLNFRIVEALGWSNLVMIDRKPEVAEVLAQVVIDTDHPYRPRYNAAQALGRLPYDGGMNLSVISVEIARLAQQVGLEYEKSPKDPLWQVAAFRVYLAFKPETELDKQRQGGLLVQVEKKAALGGAKKPVTEAYEAMLPVIRGILRSEKIPDPTMEKLNKWLNDNTAKDANQLKVHPAGQPLTRPGNHNPVAKRNDGTPAGQ